MAKQILIAILIRGNCSKPAKNSYDTNKTVVKHIDNTWSLDMLVVIEHGRTNKKS